MADQADQAQPAIKTIKTWDPDELLEWIQQNRLKLLKANTLEKFKAQEISGSVFLSLAGNVEVFKKECNLPFGPSMGLANLARDMVGPETASTGKSTDHAPLLFSFTNSYYGNRTRRPQYQKEKESASRPHTAFPKENPSRS